MTLSSSELRRYFLDFFKQRGHEIVSSSSLVPAGDPTLLFTNAGMVQFKDVFLGLEKRPYRRAVTSQKCMRVSGKHNDFENVGPSPRHHTFFEMLGNFSFGDYFKKEAVEFAWELLVTHLGLDPERLWFTVFEGDTQVPADEEAAALWSKISGRPERVLRFGRHDNFWQMGETGPCGPNSEIHYYHGERPSDPNFNRAEFVNGVGEETIEIWNLVFMQYDMHADGTLMPLPRPSVDTGAGFERLAAVLQGKISNYETDLFVPIIDRIQKLLGKSADDFADAKRAVSYRVIADHARAVTFLIADGVNPSNDGRGYVTRLILRRAARHGQLLGFTEPFLADVIPTVIELMGEAYPEIVKRREHILRTTLAEEEKFLQTLRIGSEMLDDMIAELQARGSTIIPGEEAFRLYDTFGFPVDLTREVARESQMTVDDAGYKVALNEASERSRSASSMLKGDDAALRKYRKALDTLRSESRLPDRGVNYEPYKRTSLNANVVGIFNGDELVNALETGGHGELILSSTPFYVESGGQISDTGRILRARENGNGTGEWEFRVDDTRQPVPGLVVHRGQMVSGTAHIEDVAVAEVDASRRLAIMRNHTATHLLHAALRSTLGEHVQQAGSLVAPDRLRFDFTHNKPVSADDLDEIETKVMQAILANYPVQPFVLPYKEAVGKGAMALFTEKYGDTVRMLEIDGVSRELCGGTHVSQTSEIGLFQIISESSVGAGLRRIEAVTGESAYEEISNRQRTLRAVGSLVRANPDEIETKIQQLLGTLAARDKEIERLFRESAKRQAVGSTDRVHMFGNVQVVAQVVDAPSIELLRWQADSFRDHLGSAVVSLGAVINDKPQLIVSVTPDLVQRGFDARRMVNVAAQVMGGGGGGKPSLAQAGGRDPDKLRQALDIVLKFVEDMEKSG